ncbi:MAG: winged helix-turn-helix domain-containing protein, partial [Nannocystaceae bacterium]
MTFLEAAIEVLRDAPEPLHYSAIAKEAVERNLLSHVGRDPEAAMQKCLTSAVRAGEEALLQRSKPA